MSISVSPAIEADESDWDQFVYAHEDATFFHRFGWSRVLRSAFGHRTHFLVARNADGVCGVLPLAEVRSLLFGRRLSSLPFAVYGGVLASSPEVADALRQEACALADRLKVGSLELRNRDCADADWPVKELYFTFRKTLESDHQANLKAIPNRQRAMLRKALKEGLYSEETGDTKRLYRVYSESVRNLGTPVFSRKYLDVLMSEFGDDCRIMMIRQRRNGQPIGAADDQTLLADAESANVGDEDVAGVMSFYFRGEVLPYYGGSVTRARSIKGCNHILYWELMRRSTAEGCTGFDFGRSKAGTGPYSFKKNFGFVPALMPYEYYLVRDEELPDMNPNNPKYQRLVGIWQKLPLPAANTLGPFIARSLG